jgi:hypothetical protein
MTLRGAKVNGLSENPENFNLSKHIRFVLHLGLLNFGNVAINHPVGTAGKGGQKRTNKS